jgi:hypothetical protein
VAAGERAADFFTLVSSALRNDLGVRTSLRDVLERLLSGSTDYEPLRPDLWRATHPEAIRQHRLEERRDRAESQQRRRSQCRAAQSPHG